MCIRVIVSLHYALVAPPTLRGKAVRITLAPVALSSETYTVLTCTCRYLHSYSWLQLSTFCILTASPPMGDDHSDDDDDEDDNIYDEPEGGDVEEEDPYSYVPWLFVLTV